ncbi:trehalose operon repressor [Domibacillus epiphyticus]|uniref:Trehalose operon repressor n=1 Tax=Domibacillus epiphyticus TaxID=1714355 RepID=A0A1V2A5G6_9BACI|nr:trehalose operon repressor [Domibacillus epiphyticus]OMP66216.1 trehalose operon repressor [Domibacillus epiphyticus]
MKINKYKHIYEELAAKMKDGIFQPGELIPSENELAQQYETSRETIRKALTLLSQNGYIQKLRGKGSVVLDTSRAIFPVSGLVSFKELAEQMKGPVTTRVEEFGLIKPEPFLQHQLQCNAKDDTWKVTRTRAFDDERVILDKDFLLKKFIPDLTEEICKDSIYSYIEQELGLTISFAKKEIVVESCTEEDKQYLDLNGFLHVVVVKNYVYLDDASLFQYTESRHRLDKFRFVDFARRQTT